MFIHFDQLIRKTNKFTQLQLFYDTFDFCDFFFTDGKQEAKIFYTINGTKPDPFPKVGVEKCTMQYMGPFTLPSGKQTVKALALSK